MSIELKIKSKHLSVESQIIRFEERKLKRQIDYLKLHQLPGERLLANKWYSLNEHRRKDVRNENRATFLARAYLDGKPYAVIEKSRKPEGEMNFKSSIIPRVLAMVNKYGRVEVSKDQILEWSKL